MVLYGGWDAIGAGMVGMQAPAASGITPKTAKMMAGLKTVGTPLWNFYKPVVQWGDLIKDMQSNDPDVRNRAGVDLTMDATLKLLTTYGALATRIPGKSWDAVIGPLPIPMVTYYDFAESDSIVKYRAMGGEFFAHQGGDKTALRVDILLVGPEKELFMNMLRFLRLMCKSQTRGQTLTHQDESYLFDPINAQGEGLWQFKHVKHRRAVYEPAFTRSEIVQLAADTGTPETVVEEVIYDITGAMDVTTITPGRPNPLQSYADWERAAQRLNMDPANLKALVQGKLVADLGESSEFIGVAPASHIDPLSIQQVMATDRVMQGFSGEYFHHDKAYYDMQQLGYYTYHVNFPVVIDNMIFTDMWLETVQFTHDSKNGVDAVVGHLLLRKYIAPPRIRWTASGQNVSRLLGRKERDARGKVKATPMDKWVWVWQDMVKPDTQIYEYKIGMTVGMARAAMLTASGARYKYINAGFLQTTHRSVSITAVFS